MLYTGEVGDGDNPGLFTNAMDQISCELAGRSASTIGDTDKRRSKVFELDDMVKELVRTFAGLGREKLKRKSRPVLLQYVPKMLHATSKGHRCEWP